MHDVLRPGVDIASMDKGGQAQANACRCAILEALLVVVGAHKDGSPGDVATARVRLKERMRDMPAGKGGFGGADMHTGFRTTVWDAARLMLNEPDSGQQKKWAEAIAMLIGGLPELGEIVGETKL